MTTDNELDTFTRAYIKCALWCSSNWGNDEDCPPSFESDGYTVDDMAPEALAECVADCEAFQRDHSEDIGMEAGQAGYDFWLTRNGHGAGFWDGDWPEAAGQRLTDASKVYGSVDPYLGDDGRIYV